jgi:hypothetical protein
MSSQPPKRPFPFTIENILGMPAPKRPHPEQRPKRPFSIRSLLDLPPTPPPPPQPQQGGSAQPQLGYFVDKLRGDSNYNKKFNRIQWASKFAIKALPNNPDYLLLNLIQYCIDATIDECTNKWTKPDHLGVIISSELLDPDIWVPIRPLDKETVFIIMDQFLKVTQSKARAHSNLWDKPFTVTVTAINRGGLPSERQIIGSGPRKLAPVQHKIKQKALIRIKNRNDKYCLFLALQATKVHQMRGHNRSQFYDYLNGRDACRGLLQREALELMEAIGAPMGLPEYDARIYVPMVINYWNSAPQVDKHRYKVFIFGSSGHYKPMYKCGPNDYDTPILLYFDEKHFDGIRTTNGMFNQAYCLACEMVYDTQQKHKMQCKARCLNCARVGPQFPCPIDDYRKKCKNCSKLFKNKDCYKEHLANGYCQKSKRCKECGAYWNVNLNCRNGRQGHVCDERHCATCGCYHNKERGCFIQPLDLKPKKKCLFVGLDAETKCTKPVNPLTPNDGKKEHEVVFIAARVCCPDCIENGQWKENLAGKIDGCEICGENRTVSFGHFDFSETDVDFPVKTMHPTRDFVKWILELSLEYEVFAFAHNGGKFDFMFICEELYLEGINPTMLKRGNKLYELKVEARKDQNSKIVFRDSLNLLSMPLGQLPSAFGLDVQEKPFFPYAACRDENYGVRMAKLPPKKDYLCQGMMPAKRKEFDQWYAEHENDGFFLDEEVAKYCLNDVDILMAALIKFRGDFMAITKRPPVKNGKADRAAILKPHYGLDPLRECMTIASATMKHFRMNHLPADHLAVIPENGYDRADNQSLLAMKFMKWFAEKNKVQIQTAYSAEGEKKIEQFQLDGWIESEKLAIEVNGCAWHGCPRCYTRDDMILPNGKTAGYQRERDQRRMEFIRTKVPKVLIFWECEIQAMLRDDPEMKESFENYLDEGPLNIRSCFYGGRTGPLKLYYKAKPNEEIKDLDVTSLYPYANFMLDELNVPGYPIGIPKVHVLNRNVDWRRPEDNPFPMALLKVFVVPPKQIDVPVLPMKLEGDERLLFPLCSKCARKFPTGDTNEDYCCGHSDRERGWVSNCTSIELNAALAEGYRVEKVIRVLEYTKSDNNLFRGYMREFLAEKFHASGFDAKIKGDGKAEEQFIQECWEMFGMKLERSKMKSNKGMRALAKLCVNNLWGRFALRNYGLAQSYITDDPAELGEYLDDRSIDVMAVDELTPDAVMISYIKKKEFIEEHDCSNVGKYFSVLYLSIF